MPREEEGYFKTEVYFFVVSVPGANVGKVKVQRRTCGSLKIKHPTRTTLQPKSSRTTSSYVNAGGDRRSRTVRAATFSFGE